NQVSGEYSFNGNRVRLGGDVPMLNDVNGKLDFSERELRSTALSAKVLGGPAKLSLMSADGQLRITAQGSANLGELRNEYPGRVLINRLSGTTDWQIVLNARPTLTTWTLESNLKGAVVDLPAPAGKAAADAVPLRIEHRPDGAGRDMIAINYQRVGRLVLGRRAGSGNPVVDRAMLVLGSAQGDASRPGLWIRGDIDTVDVDDWLALKQQLDAAEPASVLALSGLELSAKTIDIFGRRLSDLHVAAARSGEDWQIDMGARELLGSA